MTAEDAAAGRTGTSDPSAGDGTPPDSGDTTDGQQATILELVSASDATTLDYEFTVDGRVSKYTVSDRVGAEGNDAITDNGDGTVTVRGTAGNGYGDAYAVDGAIVAMDLDESKWRLTADGQSVSVADLVVPVVDRFTINQSERLGDDRLYAVRWRVSDAEADLDTVEIVAVEATTDVNFAVTDANGASASGWDLFRFPADSTLDVSIRVTDAAGNVTERKRSVGR